MIQNSNFLFWGQDSDENINEKLSGALRNAKYHTTIGSSALDPKPPKSDIFAPIFSPHP